jgi:hypothetical protein
VDLSDPFRQFSKEEWEKIPYNVRDKIRSKREKNKNKKKEKRKVSAVSTDEDKEDDDGDSQATPKSANVSFGSKAYKKNKVSEVVLFVAYVVLQ